MTDELSLRRTKVDLDGLMMVLSDHLYSTPHVALRELVQNAHDSCRRRQLEDRAPFMPRITVRCDPAAGALHIEDNGAGLTDEEIERYLATVGTGYTRELRKAGHERDGLIGYFGLGFLSAFVVSERVDLHTCSYQRPDAAWQYTSRDPQSYLLRRAPHRDVGTVVTLTLSKDHRELAEPETVRALLRRYCCLLEHPVDAAGELVNERPPPWRDPETHSVAKRRALEGEFAQRFEPRFEPLFTIPITGDAGDPEAVRGLVWIQDGATYGTSDNRRVWSFVRGMMVSNEDRELLPPWAGFCGAVIESEVLTPTASRETLQRDRHYDAARERVRETLVDGLAEVARTNAAAWERLLLRHNESLLGAAIADPRLFTLLQRDLTVPTSEGDLPVPRVVERSRGRLCVTQAQKGGAEELLFRALKVPVVNGTRYGALPFCRLYAERHGVRLVMIGTEGGDEALFAREALGPSELTKLEEWLGADDVEVVPSRFEPSYLPVVLVPDRDAQLKKVVESDEANKRISGAALHLMRVWTKSVDRTAGARLYVNLGCPAVAALIAAPAERARAGVALLRTLVALSGEAEHAGKYMPIDAALRLFCDTVEGMLETGEHLN
ncbi:MAG: ATP-binding protein [Sandaracinaceae bacterium]|nr:ATP-binding protein [Sandaracinaceae bacterium]